MVFAQKGAPQFWEPDTILLIQRLSTEHTLGGSVRHASGRRLILNIKEVMHMLQKKALQYNFKFKQIAFETLTPEEQVRVLSHTVIMVGFHGAAHTNAVFMQPGTAVVELFPYKFKDYRFLDLNRGSKRHWLPWFNKDRNATLMPEPNFYKPEFENMDDAACVQACARYCYANRRDADTIVNSEEVASIIDDAIMKMKAPWRAPVTPVSWY